jgi:putative nucleotidyltransferase with HDIG domain/YgiT-type zinc finger domain-containing protein
LEAKGQLGGADYLEGERLSQQSKSNLLATITVLIKLIEMRDPYTEGHSEKVSMWSEIVAQNLGLNKDEQEEIKLAARLHDIGKIGIPDRILNKPGKLNKEEYAEIKKHPGLGADILSNIDRLKKVSRIIRHHHEWYNGKGYPDGLVGEEIPLGSRIINVVDAYQAMRSDRPYRKAFPKEKAITELKRGAGTQFDPEIVRVFIRILNENISFVLEQRDLNREKIIIRMGTRCDLCGGELQKKVVKIQFYENHDRIIIKLQTDVCKKCGRTFYSDTVANKIIKIKEKMDEYIDKRLPKIQEVCDKVHLQTIGEEYETLEVIS